MMGFGGIDHLFQPPGHAAASGMPIADPIYTQGYISALLSVMPSYTAINYRMDRIPKTMPPVLAQLKLGGLHHYPSQTKFSYQHSMAVAAFMEKAVREVDFPEHEWPTEPGEPHIMAKIKDVFRACLVDNVVTIE
jgi:hypothetical protein